MNLLIILAALFSIPALTFMLIAKLTVPLGLKIFFKLTSFIAAILMVLILLNQFNLIHII